MGSDRPHAFTYSATTGLVREPRPSTGDGDGFSGLKPALRGAAEAHAGGGAGGDDVAGEQRRDGGDVFDEVRDLEDELAGVGVLQDFAVDGEADVERVRVGDFVGGDDGGAHGAEGGKLLARDHCDVASWTSRALTSLTMV